MSRENVEVVRRMFDAFNNMDTESTGEAWIASGGPLLGQATSRSLPVSTS